MDVNTSFLKKSHGNGPLRYDMFSEAVLWILTGFSFNWSKGAHTKSLWMHRKI